MIKMDRLKERASRCRQDPKMVKGARIMAALVLLAGALDVISTNTALAAGLVEANPFVGAVQDYLGHWWSVPKITWHLALALFIIWLPSRRMLRVSTIVILGYATIIINNFYMIGQQA